jgi:hypothetical protein
MLERVKEATRHGKYTGIKYARFADDLVILIDAHPRHDWLLPAVEIRLREELAALQVEVNEEKSRIVDLCLLAATSAASKGNAADTASKEEASAPQELNGVRHSRKA